MTFFPPGVRNIISEMCSRKNYYEITIFLKNDYYYNSTRPKKLFMCIFIDDLDAIKKSERLFYYFKKKYTTTDKFKIMSELIDEFEFTEEYINPIFTTPIDVSGVLIEGPISENVNPIALNEGLYITSENINIIIRLKKIKILNFA